MMFELVIGQLPEDGDCLCCGTDAAFFAGLGTPAVFGPDGKAWVCLVCYVECDPEKCWVAEQAAQHAVDITN